MAEQQSSSNHYEREYESRREKEIAAEKWQVERVKQLAQQMAEECPWVWRFGDGDGGAVINYIYDAFEEAGLRTCPNPHNSATGEGK